MEKQEEKMRAGEIKTWLDQGLVILLEECKVESESQLQGDTRPPNLIDDGWAIYLLETKEILTVHTETLSSISSKDSLKIKRGLDATLPIQQHSSWI